MKETDKKPGIPREDKVALVVIFLVCAVLVTGILFTIRAILQMFGLALDTATDGIGFRTAFISGVGLSFVFMLVFALFAGDGVIGELGVMLIGFFVMVAFFTFSIALIL